MNISSITWVGTESVEMLFISLESRASYADWKVGLRWNTLQGLSTGPRQNNGVLGRLVVNSYRIEEFVASDPTQILRQITLALASVDLRIKISGFGSHRQFPQE